MSFEKKDIKVVNRIENFVENTISCSSLLQAVEGHISINFIRSEYFEFIKTQPHSDNMLLTSLKLRLPCLTSFF